ncbi:MAG: YdcF family protein [Chloroflexales bacterium]|nr:YdcF family protein [Chloroflexales bacterium]
MTRPIIVRILHYLRVLIGMILAAWLLVCGLAIIQGQNDETRRVDAIVLVGTPPPPPAHLAYAVDLYRRGYASRFLLTGEHLPEIQNALAVQGLTPETIVLAEASGSRTAQLQQAADIARSEGIESILIVDKPNTLLLSLKVMHDLGLNAYGAPIPATPIDISAVLREGVDYWAYVLLGIPNYEQQAKVHYSHGPTRGWQDHAIEDTWTTAVDASRKS